MAVPAAQCVPEPISFSDEPPRDHTRLLRAELMAASFILAVLTYVLVEKPIRFGARARKEKVYALLVGMVIVGGAGLSVNWMEGLPERGVFKKLAAIAKQLEIQ
jgi:peptidoglycan/LPS O-acetylase OafA/YrhL